MGKIISFIFNLSDSTSFVCKNKEDFLKCISEEIDCADENGLDHFEVTLEPSCY